MPKTLLLASAAAVFLTGCTITPTPLSQSDLAENARVQKASLASAQVPVTDAISIYEAMARALKYNLDHRVAMMESALAKGETRVATLEMLPDLTSRAGYNGRNNYSGSFSRPILDKREVGAKGGRATTSSDLKSFSGDLTLSWNILDFGLSYVRAQQAGDRALIAAEKERSVANRLIEDVRSAYWRAISADYLRSQFKLLEGQTRVALSRSRKQRKSGLIPPITGLTYERELLDINKQIHNLTADLLIAKAELAKLMNLTPGTTFQLEQPKRHHRYPALGLSLDEMTDIGLQNRPEMREVLYEGRINAKETRANLLELLPTAQLNVGLNGDTNDLLFNSNWIGAGASAAWNVMRILKYHAKRNVTKAKGEIIREQALATSMAIMTQIHVGRIRYAMLSKELHATNHYYQVQRQLLAQVKRQAQAGAAGDQTVIRERMNTLVARVKRDVVYADFQNALASIFWSMGIDPYDVNLSTDQSLEAMTQSLESLWRDNRLPDARTLTSGVQVAKAN